MKLSIITINLNNAQGLSKTIESVINQSFKDYEFIVIDGDSNDDSLGIINSYKDSINKWLSETDTGIYNAMNKGLNLAQGDYVYFLNSGDRLAAESTLEQVFGVMDYGEDLLYGDSLRRNEVGEWVVHQQPSQITVGRFWGMGICHQTIFYKKKLFDKLGKFDENLKIVADWEFNIRALMDRCTSLHLPLPVVCYEGGGVSAIQTDLAAEEKAVILKRHLPNAVYQDYLQLLFLEQECARLKKYEDWVDQIKNGSWIINVAMVTKWFGLKVWSSLCGHGNNEIR